MSTLTPLQVHGAPRPEDVAAIREAKAALALPYLIIPVEAVAGGPTRVLALREEPTFLCDSMLVRDPPATPEGMKIALAWVLDPATHDRRASLLIDKLRAIFGADVTEIPYVPDVPLPIGVRFQ